jgi:Flp pilus assembly protein TadG
MTVRSAIRDERGSAAIEFAIAVPVLIMMIWGMFQISILLEANAGVEQALGEGARYATIYNTTTNARPTNDQISAKITGAKFGTGAGTWQTPVIDTANEASDRYITINVEYDVPTDFLLFDGPNVTIAKSKRVYIQTA